MTDKEIKSGNCFLMIVVPKDKKKQRIYGPVPKTFKLEAPPEGWKKCPTQKELYEMSYENYKKRYGICSVGDSS